MRRRSSVCDSSRAFELVLVDPATRTPRRPVWRDDAGRDLDGLASLSASLVDLDRDGATVRALDLGDGTTALRVRSARDEYYVLAGSSTIAAVPACLE